MSSGKKLRDPISRYPAKLRSTISAQTERRVLRNRMIHCVIERML
jgi:hypothetical protein